MNIAFVLPDLSLCGGVRAVFELAEGLSKKGHNLYIIYPFLPYVRYSTKNRHIKNFYHFSNNFLKLVVKSNNNLYNKAVKILPIFSLSPTKYSLSFLNRIIEQHNIDTVIATAWATAFFVNKIKMLAVKKFYFVQHYEILELWNSESAWQEAERISKSTALNVNVAMCKITNIERNLLNIKKSVDITYRLNLTIITTSTFLRDCLQVLGIELKTTLTGIGNNFSTFYKKRVERNYGISKDKIIVILPYRNQFWKGDRDGMYVMNNLLEKYNNINIILFGRLKSLKKHLDGRIYYFESPSDEILNDLYNLADIGVFPSWSEGFGSTPLEAMVCETACCCTDVGAIRDYAKQGETVLVSPPRQKEVLFDNVRCLIENEELRKKMANKAWEYVQQFTWQRTIDIFERNIYDS